MEELQKEVIRHKWSFQKISDDDSKTRFYTGLPSFAVFMWFFSILRPKAERMKYWSGPNTDQSSDRKRASAGSLDLIDQTACWAFDQRYSRTLPNFREYFFEIFLFMDLFTLARIEMS